MFFDFFQLEVQIRRTVGVCTSLPGKAECFNDRLLLVCDERFIRTFFSFVIWVLLSFLSWSFRHSWSAFIYKSSSVNRYLLLFHLVDYLTLNGLIEEVTSVYNWYNYKDTICVVLYDLKLIYTNSNLVYFIFFFTKL